MTPRSSWRRRRAALAATAASVLVAALAGATPALAAPTPHWALESRSAPTNLPPGGEAQIVVSAINLGDAEVNGETEHVAIADTLPAGLEATKVEAGDEPGVYGRTASTCSAPSSTPIVCTWARKFRPFEEAELFINVKVKLPSGAKPVNQASVSGGKEPNGEAVPPASLSPRPLEVSELATEFGVEHYELTPENEDGSRDTEAGSHPFQLTTTFDLNETMRDGVPSAPALTRNLSFALPPGLLGDANVLGNPNAVKQCTGSQFGQQAPGEARDNCPADTAVGVAVVTADLPTLPGYGTYRVPVFNLAPPPGEPAQFGFWVQRIPIVLNTSVRTGGDYGVTVNVENTTELADVLDSTVTIWGVPTAAAHDQSRGWACLDHEDLGPGVCEEHFEVPAPAPLLTLPTSCTGRPASSVSGESWPSEAGTVSRLGEGTESEANTRYTFPQALTGCELLGFAPRMSVQAESEDANTPTGLTVHVHMPWESEGRSEAAVRTTKLEFPPGLLLSPSAANGLEACAEGETEPGGGVDEPPGGVGFIGNSELDPEFEPGALTSTFTEKLPEPERLKPGTNFCANASKVGIVRIRTPDLPNELEGGVYLARQNKNPFGSLFAMYIVAQDPVSKVLVKLAGEVEVGPTGKIVSTFKNTPDVPVEELTVELFGGPRASLTTPPTCESYKSKANMGSWSGSAAEPSDSFEVSHGAEGGECLNPQPFEPSFTAGSTNSQAGAFTPFTLKIEVPQADSALRTISNMQLPPGLAAAIASVTPCPEPQAADGTCGTESEIGKSTALSGLGSEPYALKGQVYLTGPYDGAPFGLSAVTYADAGPFHLGRVVVRSSIAINQSTAAATINTEAARFINNEGKVTEWAGFPPFVEGVPSQIKTLYVIVNRRNFEFNPTSCSPMSITATLEGAGGEKAVSTPFQVSGCASLPFEPKLTASVLGPGSKADGTAFTVKIESPGVGQANIHKVDLTLPSALPSRLSTIQKACPEAVFDANPASCDEGSVIGEGIVHTPVLANPLRGPAYLVSHGGAAFPDVEFVLQGEGVKIVVDGKTDIKDGVTYSRFETAPDVPFTTFETLLPAGPHSALTANVPEDEHFSLCKTALSMPTQITAQDGSVIEQDTQIAVTGCGGVLGSKTKLTRAQLLAKALKACKKDRKKSKRAACEKAARRKYGAKASSKHGAKASSKHRA